VKPDSHRLVALDAACIAAVSLAICLASRHLLFMTALVPAVILARFLALASLADHEGVSMRAELAFFALCTALGSFNDWNSVCHKKIYEYTVPHFFSFSTIPLWMLLFWGMILRFIARLARWERLGPDESASNRVGIGKMRTDHAGLKVMAELSLLVATRWTVYQLYADPVLSWTPFLVAIFLFTILLGASQHDAKLLGLFLLAGPAVEIFYIQIGGLHRYALGWIGGVPLWIVMWWALSILIWKDLAFRIEKRLRAALGGKG